MTLLHVAKERFVVRLITPGLSHFYKVRRRLGTRNEFAFAGNRSDRRDKEGPLRNNLRGNLRSRGN
jgi:hypothetical protein